MRVDSYWYHKNLITWLLLPLAGLFYGISLTRKLLFKIGVLKSFKLPVPVIVVGNISVGGTGKTPLIIELCKQLIKKGLKPGVISRGYRGQSKTWPVDVGQCQDALLSGDEPQIIYRQTACPVVVSADRVAAAHYLLKHYHCDVILSDDGLQHYRLRRDYEIAVVDHERQFGNRLCLPAGPLREPVSRLKSVDMVISNSGEDDDSSFTVMADQLVSLVGAKSSDLSVFKHHHVHAVAGIGNPQRFFKLLKQAQIDYIPHIFPDHYVFQAKDLQFNDELAVLMTEKDAVKCNKFAMKYYWYLPINIRLSDSAQQQLDQIIEQIIKQTTHKPQAGGNG
jgi:tetraacyldisaccharide 4'-kinase